MCYPAPVPGKVYDAIIVGTGACGGFAAKELTEKGLDVLVLDAGPMPVSGRDFAQHQWPYEQPFRGLGGPGAGFGRRARSSDQVRLVWGEHPDHPYTTEPGKPFRWVRSRVVGGRTLHWSRAAHRFSDFDFQAASRDGYGDDWPIRYADLAPWYDRVERHIGVSAYREGFPQLPDGVFLPGMPYNCAEEMFRGAARRLGLPVTHRRVAQLSRPHNGRPACHYCGACGQGCDIGAMFNSVASTLPWAEKTGRMTLRPNSIVRAVLTREGNRARGVSYIDRLTRQDYQAEARAVILAASSLESTRILLNSARGGLGNSSGLLGNYLMDQISGGGVSGFLTRLKGSPSRNDDGKASGAFVPNFRNLGQRHPKFIRGYCLSATGGCQEFPQHARTTKGYGGGFKKQVRRGYPAAARIWLSAGEMLARKENRVEIDPTRADAWGIPVLKVVCTHGENERALYADAVETMKEWFTAAGGEIVSAGGGLGVPGGLIHEVGTCRMGANAKTSVVDPFCRMHDIPNVFVFGGGPFVSSGVHHPTLTMMALTVRGCDHLADQFRRGDV